MQPNGPTAATSEPDRQDRGSVLARPLSTDEAAELRSLHRNVLRVWRLSAGIAAAIFGLLALAAIAAGAAKFWDGMHIFAGVSGAIALLFAWSATVYSGWRYAAWRYGVRAHDVVAGYGVFWRTRRCIPRLRIDRKSTRLNSSHLGISYAVFC